MFSFFLLINKNGAHKKNNCNRDNLERKAISINEGCHQKVYCEQFNLIDGNDFLEVLSLRIFVD